MGPARSNHQRSLGRRFGQRALGLVHQLLVAAARAPPYTASDYGADTDLLTRQAAPHNFASDTSIRRNGTDPQTGDRYLEELAFEISTQSTEDLEQRARIMAARGVRRIFAIPVCGDAAGSQIIAGPLAEWIAAEVRWRTYRDDEIITDPCLFRPLLVRALLDAVEADKAVAQALLGKEHPVLIEYGNERYRAGEEKGRKEGKESGVRDSIRQILRTRGLTVDAAAHARIDECRDLEILQRWIARAVQVTSASELFGDD
jgi:hypothetical protein